MRPQRSFPRWPWESAAAQMGSVRLRPAPKRDSGAALAGMRGGPQAASSQIMVWRGFDGAEARLMKLTKVCTSGRGQVDICLRGPRHLRQKASRGGEKQQRKSPQIPNSHHPWSSCKCVTIHFTSDLLRLLPLVPSPSWESPGLAGE